MNSERLAKFIAIALMVTGMLAPVMIEATRAARAATLVVDTIADENDGNYSAGDLSLREAVDLANNSAGADTITFDTAGVFSTPQTIALTLGQLMLTDTTGATTIQGHGADRVAISGSNTSRVFQVMADVTVSFIGLTIKEGNSGNDIAGAILNYDGATRGGTVTIRDSVITDNTSSSIGGAIYNLGTMIITGSTVSNNTSTTNTGGIFHSSSGQLELINSTVSGNTSALRGAGVFINAGPAVITNSTISGNQVTGNVNGNNNAGGIQIDAGTVTITSSTITNNTAPGAGGGVFNPDGPGRQLILRNTIIAGNNSTGTSSDDLHGVSNTISQGYNLIGSTSGNSGVWTGTDLQNVSPQLGPLQDNGGPTETHALLPNSPAIDKGDSSSLATDQRGFNRPEDLNDATYPDASDGSDIGAFEVQDGDNDSVPDEMDACPDTPTGTTVNAAGCAAGQCFPPPSGMVSWWPFDETGGTSAADIQGGNNGTVSGAKFTSGQVGNALDFDGVDDSVTVPDSPSLRTPTDAITVDAWVYWRGHSGDTVDRVVAKRYGSAEVTHHLLIVNNRLHFCVNIINSIGGGDCAIDPNSFPANRWVHVAGTYDGSNIRLFIDGVEVATEPYSGGQLLYDSGGLEIGWYSPDFPERWNGLIDEVEIFSRALSPAEINAIYLAGSAGKCRPPSITAATGVTRERGSSSSSQIATVSDAEDQEANLAVTVSSDGMTFSSSATKNGVSISAISVDSMGNVTATVAAGCAATDATFTLKVTDSTGATDTDAFTVTVTADNTSPAINCKNVAAQSANAGANCQATVPDVRELVRTQSSDNCTAQNSLTITQSPMQGSTVNGTGSHPITVTVKDANDKSAQCVVAFTVSDDATPIINCANVQAQSANADANCKATVPDVRELVRAQSSDNCTGQGSLTITQSPAQGSQVMGAGSHPITVTVKDAANKSAQCVVAFTVIDNNPPQITCPPNVSTTASPGSCAATVNPGMASATDNCGVQSVTGTRSDGQMLNAPYPKGQTTITWKATDTSGNMSACQQTITVADSQLPSITCPADITAVTAQACPPATGTVVTFNTPNSNNGTLTDNCPNVFAVCSPPSGSTFPLGTTTVTCTATDASGNTASCSFRVTVFNGCLQDDSNPGNVVLFNTATGEYRFCCNGVVVKAGVAGGVTTSGNGVYQQGCNYTIRHYASDRRVVIQVSFTTKRGDASLQSPPGNNQCSITDRNIANNTCQCAAVFINDR